jgi:hypothetical protein
LVPKGVLTPSVVESARHPPLEANEIAVGGHCRGRNGPLVRHLFSHETHERKSSPTVTVRYVGVRGPEIREGCLVSVAEGVLERLCEFVVSGDFVGPEKFGSKSDLYEVVVAEDAPTPEITSAGDVITGPAEELSP